MLKFYQIYLFQIVKSLTISRIWNILVLRFYFILSTIFKIHKTNLYPSYISIEPTNMCNLHCPECPTGNNSSTIAKGKISMELFRSFIPQIAKKTIFVNLYFQGEPFLHDSLTEMISIIHEHKMISSISTNAHFITEKNAEAIVKSGLTKIIVSLDGYNQKTYEIYRKNGSFDTVLQGLHLLNQAKTKLHSSTPLIELQCLLFKHTQDNKEEIKRIGKQFGADITVFKTAQFYDLENIYMLPDSKHSRYKINNQELELTKPIKNRCWRMWSSCVISWQGNVLPCCFDKDQTFSYGNISEKKFNEILQSKNIQNFKKIVHTNRNNIKMCRNCTS